MKDFFKFLISISIDSNGSTTFLEHPLNKSLQVELCYRLNTTFSIKAVPVVISFESSELVLSFYDFVDAKGRDGSLFAKTLRVLISSNFSRLFPICDEDVDCICVTAVAGISSIFTFWSIASKYNSSPPSETSFDFCEGEIFVDLNLK
uniref:Uncharacterized protein n=1 Tax=Rhizophagus irregularis (strain DAOM 181602 / DAOM 197198 / MUCL 43194) TaxID=747089 RepID=U9TB47_RHIID